MRQEKGWNNMEVKEYLEELGSRYPQLREIEESVWQAFRMIGDSYERGGKLLIAGNGGSCADAEHIVGELMKGFVKRRQVPEDFASKLRLADEKRGEELAGKLQGGLPAIALSGHPGLSTAFLNDVDGNLTYAQQVYGYGRPEDVFLGISTSGNAQNIMYGAVVARAKGMKVLTLTGRDGGKLREISDLAVIVPAHETYKIQEFHLPVYHTLCLMLEEHFFPS